MGGTQMVFLIVLVVAAVQVVKIIYKEPRPADTGAVNQLKDRLSALEKRIENIETITTSKEFDLKREFEELAK